jgi:rhodanese-related sulfurtransferase
MQSINRQELESMNEQAKEDFVLVNVLSPDNFRKAHIRTSINIPHEDPDFTRIMEKVAGDKSRKIVVYCASFDCDASEKAARKLEKAGFGKVFDYEGGTKDWLENHH